ncbi:MAG: hypothetical protein JNK74_00155 [Candidatus Hydrogenedentes bacterium]|nr:hypothetical protein [Candidatus Hydrogenedentota bacterium]
MTSLEPVYQIAYWGLFLVSLLVALYMALLDLRYIRMQYSLGEKELFEDTLGSEEFRAALRKAQNRPAPPEDERRGE